MEAVVVYESQFGNTRQIAEAISRGLGDGARAVVPDEVRPEKLAPGSLLVVGSPIVGWRPLEDIGAWLASMDPGSLKGLRAAAFDTRVRLFFHGDAAKKIARALDAAGAELVADPIWFYVEGKEGPLLDGELERAEQWGAHLAAPQEG
ncbi:flavodoxin domain-containing protein [Sinomonas sp. JGH33]|uniref:Flavodoxin domain-containing protein n=1 Tax=Sinomonas terricola TaxID=3110330 RepID=A0ABU5T471_9MICC|nr:flavodoxin domain-containing protein [Sinomonas sp. JGH33]MEA5454347.1 flavodoxin domain-containing protein [Sinomonas sp. JGH33]